MKTRREFFAAGAGAGVLLTVPLIARAQTAPVAGYQPGDLRYYGAVPNSDVTGALADAIASSAPVYIPSALGMCTVSAPMLPISQAVTIYGDGPGMSVLHLMGDFPLLSVAANVEDCVFRDFTISGAGETGTVTQPAILYTNAAYNAISRMRIEWCGIGVQYLPGVTAPYSSFLNSIRDSQLLYHTRAGVSGGKGTNALNLSNVTVGGGSTPYGVVLTDSNSLTWMGGCIGTVTQSGLSLTNPTVKGAGSHKLTGISMEGTVSALGDLLLGSASGYPVLGISVDSLTMDPGTGADSGVNVVNAYGVQIFGTVFSGYYGPNLTDGWLRISAASKGVTATVASSSGVYTYPVAA
jgi:hypothetical protein